MRLRVQEIMAFKKWSVRDLETLGDGKFVSLGVQEIGSL